MYRKKIVAGNWKMNGRLDQVKHLLLDLRTQIKEINLVAADAACVVLPPAIYIPLTQEFLQNSPIQWGGQNIYPALQGAFTGEHSLLMYQDYGCRYMLVGHSERRQLFGETEKFIAEKFHLIKEHDMIPLLCVGETREERLQGRAQEVLENQLRGLLERDRHCFHNAVIAYEPVWAIGTGETATPEQAQEMHHFIRETLNKKYGNIAQDVSILYGGSVKPDNAAEIFSKPDVDGGLIGGAALKAADFTAIVRAI